MTRGQIISEFHRLCALTFEAEALDLIDMEEGQRMRDRYRERADAVLKAHKQTEKMRA